MVLISVLLGSINQNAHQNDEQVQCVNAFTSLYSINFSCQVSDHLYSVYIEINLEGTSYIVISISYCTEYLSVISKHEYSTYLRALMANYSQTLQKALDLTLNLVIHLFVTEMEYWDYL